VQQQEGEQGTQSPSVERDRPTILEHLERPQHSELHGPWGCSTCRFPCKAPRFALAVSVAVTDQGRTETFLQTFTIT
jgi:hypothetical protein